MLLLERRGVVMLMTRCEEWWAEESERRGPGSIEGRSIVVGHECRCCSI